MRKNWGRRNVEEEANLLAYVRSLNFVILHLLVFPSPSLVASPTCCCSPDLITFKYFRYLFKTHISLLLFTHRKPINQVNKQTKTVGILYILWKRRSTTHKHNNSKTPYNSFKNPHNPTQLVHSLSHCFNQQIQPNPINLTMSMSPKTLNHQNPEPSSYHIHSTYHPFSIQQNRNENIQPEHPQPVDCRNYHM